MKVKEWFKNLLAGFAIGVGAAIPGVSGAAIAVVFKVYEKIIFAINNFFKQFLRSLAVLVPVLLGIILAVIPCVYLFDKALESFVFGIMCIFAGFLIGSFPSITKEVKGVKKENKHVVAIVLGIILVIALGVASVFLGRTIDINSTFDSMPWWMYLVLIPVGVLASIALTVPGLSGSLILLVIGFYKPLLSHTVGWVKECLINGNWNNFGRLIGMLACFAIGCLIGVILVSKAMKILLAKHHDMTYFAIIGFVLGSIAILFFNYNIYSYYLVWAGQTVEGVTPALANYVEIPIGIALLIAIATPLLIYNLKANKKS